MSLLLCQRPLSFLLPPETTWATPASLSERFARCSRHSSSRAASAHRHTGSAQDCHAKLLRQLGSGSIRQNTCLRLETLQEHAAMETCCWALLLVEILPPFGMMVLEWRWKGQRSTTQPNPPNDPPFTPSLPKLHVSLPFSPVLGVFKG